MLFAANVNVNIVKTVTKNSTDRDSFFIEIVFEINIISLIFPL